MTARAPCCERGGRDVRDIVCPGGRAAVRGGAAVYNAAAVIRWRERWSASYRKIWLPNYARVRREALLHAGRPRRRRSTSTESTSGVTICEDIWDDCGPDAWRPRGGGATVIINLSMSPYHLGKGEEREAMLAARARDAGASSCYVNGVGGQDELVFDGQSLVFDPRGRWSPVRAQFEEELLVVDLDLHLQRLRCQRASESGRTRVVRRRWHRDRSAASVPLLRSESARAGRQRPEPSPHREPALTSRLRCTRLCAWGCVTTCARTASSRWSWA